MTDAVRGGVESQSLPPGNCRRVACFAKGNKLGEGTYGLVLGAKHVNAKRGRFTALKIVSKQGIIDHGLPQDVYCVFWV